jgi:vitamin B12 transporter
MSRRSIPATLAGLSLAALPLAVAAQSENEDADRLDPIVVTATLGPATVGETLSSVTVVDEEDLRRQQPANFSEVMAAQPGVSLTESGSFGKQTSVFMRGHASDASALLVDGIRIRSATTGSPAWNYLPPQLIRRVEIVRGSRSSLYGADAVGGVVQAFTLPSEPGHSAWLEVGGGNFDARQYGAGASVNENGTRAALGVNRYRTDGAPVIEGGDDKGYRNTSGVASASHTFGNGVKAGFTFLSAEGNVEYEGGENDFLFQTAGVQVEVPVTEAWRTVLQFSDARDEIDGETFGTWGGPYEIDTVTRTSRLENWVTLGVHEFVIGAESQVDQVDGSTTYDESSRSNHAFFGQALLNFGRTDVNLSLRNDDNEAYGDQTTWGSAVGYRLDRHHRLRASAATSFKAPSFNDLYYPGFGNPDLEPEEAVSYELGMEGRYAHAFWDIAVFHSDVDDLSLPKQNAASSVPEARLRGIELTGGWEQAGWRVQAAATVGDYEDRQTGEPLVRRAENTVRVDLDKTVARWNFGATFRAESHRDDDVYDSSTFTTKRERIAGFGVWDLRVSRELMPGLRAALSVDNVADKEYATARYAPGTDYISAGRIVFLSARYDFHP